MGEHQGSLTWIHWGGWVVHTGGHLPGGRGKMASTTVSAETWHLTWALGRAKGAMQFPHTWNLCRCSDRGCLIQADASLIRDLLQNCYINWTSLHIKGVFPLCILWHSMRYGLQLKLSHIHCVLKDFLQGANRFSTFTTQGFYRLWILWCLIRLELWLKDFPHSVHS